VITTALVLLAGCGGSSGSAAKAALAPTPTAGSTAQLPTTGPSGSAECEALVASTAAAVASYPEVTVAHSDFCRSLDISTKLTKADVATATKICDVASRIGYAASVLNVTVLGAENVELAISVKGQPCVGEP
jgi:hypothetical protein